MASTHKKVTVLKHDRDTVHGYVAGVFLVAGKFEMLNTASKLVQIPLEDIKCVYFVREFASGDPLARKNFATRPRAEGLWLRLRFHEGDELEGLLPNNLLQFAPEGLLITPPDIRGNAQRVFIPRASLVEAQVLAVIGAGKRKPEDDRQVPMFAGD
jgi:hypothetical protein